MSYADNPYRSPASWGFAADAAVDERTDFIRKTYLHLGGAIFAFAALEAVLLNIPGIGSVVGSMFAGYNMLILMVAFMAASWIANKWAQSSTSVATQYLGLSLYVVAEAAIFLPILYIASTYYKNAIPVAAICTLLVFGGLTAVVFLTKRDFSFMRGALTVGGLVSIGMILCSMLFGFHLGVLFTGLMIALMSGYILYDTSNVLHHYRIGQHVAAALALFSSVATLFYYILRLVMELQSRD
jgi:FtsH-binding integral membrane protein